jgi:linoleoyl-CoA desaturase
MLLLVEHSTFMTSIDSLAALQKELAARGYYQKATRRILLELALGFCLSIAGTVAFVWVVYLPIKVCAIAIATIGSLIVATNTHTSSHYATSNLRWVNELLTFLGYPFFLGLSATFWWHKHLVVHHPAPNIVGVDDDADLLPWFALNLDEIERSTGIRRIYYERLQWWFFPIALAGNGFNMQRSSWAHLVSTLGHRNHRRWVYWVDVAALALHYSCWLVVPLFWFRASDVLGFYALRILLMGYALYCVLAPGHFPAEALAFPREGKNGDYAFMQTAATVNFRTRFFGRWICSGLEYQIEHHLFPNISHTHYPKVSVIVQKFCRERGLPYRSYSWGKVLWKSWLVLRQPKHVERRIGNSRTIS